MANCPFATTRGDEPVPGASCALLTDSAVPIPRGLPDSAVMAIKFLRGLGPVTCVNYSLSWLNLD